MSIEWQYNTELALNLCSVHPVYLSLHLLYNNIRTLQNLQIFIVYSGHHNHQLETSNNKSQLWIK